MISEAGPGLGTVPLTIEEWYHGRRVSATGQRLALSCIAPWWLNVYSAMVAVGQAAPIRRDRDLGER